MTQYLSSAKLVGPVIIEPGTTRGTSDLFCGPDRSFCGHSCEQSQASNGNYPLSTYTAVIIFLTQVCLGSAHRLILFGSPHGLALTLKLEKSNTGTLDTSHQMQNYRHSCASYDL